MTPNPHQIGSARITRICDMELASLSPRQVFPGLPEDIDLVLHTHLHVDHVGWNTWFRDGAWIPTFPNAEYVFSEDEYRFFSRPENQIERHHTGFMARQDSVDPVVAAGQARMIHVDGSEQLPNIYFLPTPGHTPFHSSILLDAGGATALFTGNLMHHPFQIAMPEINSVFDAGPGACRQARRYVIELAAKPNTTVFSAHFPASSALKIEEQQGGYAWSFSPSSEI